MNKGFATILVLLVVVLVIGGYLVYSGKIIINRSQETVPYDVYKLTNSSPSPTPIGADETANWKTYTNTIYKFSFKYPPAYTIISESANPALQKLFSFVIQNPERRPGGGYPQPYVEAVVYEKDVSSLEEWVSKHTTALPVDAQSISGGSLFYFEVRDKRETTLGGKKAITFKAGSMGSSPSPTFVLSRNHIIGLNLDSENESKDPDLINIYYPLILSTFKFLE